MHWLAPARRKACRRDPAGEPRRTRRGRPLVALPAPAPQLGAAASAAISATIPNDTLKANCRAGDFIAAPGSSDTTLKGGCRSYPQSSMRCPALLYAAFFRTIRKRVAPTGGFGNACPRNNRRTGHGLVHGMHVERFGETQTRGVDGRAADRGARSCASSCRRGHDLCADSQSAGPVRHAEGENQLDAALRSEANIANVKSIQEGLAKNVLTLPAFSNPG